MIFLNEDEMERVTQAIVMAASATKEIAGNKGNRFPQEAVEETRAAHADWKALLDRFQHARSVTNEDDGTTYEHNPDHH